MARGFEIVLNDLATNIRLLRNTLSPVLLVYDSYIRHQEEHIRQQVKAPEGCDYQKNGNFSCGG